MGNIYKSIYVSIIMAKQIMVRDSVIEKLNELRERLDLKSYSDVIDYLIQKAPVDIVSMVSDCFYELEEKMTRFVGDIELIEVLRVVYTRLVQCPKATEYEEYRKLKAEAVVKLLELSKCIDSIKNRNYY